MWLGGGHSFLPTPETTQISETYLIEKKPGHPLGRLHVSALAGSLAGKPTLQLTLTARGAPQKGTQEAALEWLDLGREWVVRGFTDFTTPSAHSIWKRER